MNELENTKHLLVVEDVRGKRLIDLQSETCSIGRDPRNTIVLDSSKISRFHAILLRITIPETNTQMFRIIDGDLQGTRSKNGFKVNGEVCLSYDLQDGDEISFCDEIIITYNVITKQDNLISLSDSSEAVTCITSSSRNPRRTSHKNTEELSAEERQELIQQSLERLASFPELFSNPIIEIDLKGNITYLNPAALRYFPDIKQSKLSHPILCEIFLLLKNSKKNFIMREVVVGKKIFEQSIHLISTSKLIRCYISDITKRKRAEIALKKARNELEHRVEQRTLELAKSNQILKAEIAERERVEREIRLLQNIIQSASEAPNSIVAIATTLRKVCENIGWAYGEAWIYDCRKNKLELSPAYYSKTAALDVFRKISQKSSFSGNIGIPGRVWTTKQPEWIEDISTANEIVSPIHKAASESKIKAVLGVPVIAEEEIVAVFVFFDLSIHTENIGTVRLVQSVASQLGSILQRKRAQDALNSSMATNRALLNTIPDWMFRISQYGTLINFKASKSTEVPLLLKSDFIGKRLDEVLPSEVADAMMESLIRALATQEVQLCEYQLSDRDKTRYYEARIAVNNETEKEMMAIVRDITEKKQVEQDIRDALEKQKNLNELKTRFVSMASHEFRTPLASILSSAELLEHYSHKWTEERKLNHLHRIQTSVKHMTALLNDVLLLGKAEAGKLELNPTKVDLPVFCRELVEEIQLTTNTHQIIFHTDSCLETSSSCVDRDEISQNQCFNTFLDEKLLRHILHNLLSNAIKYSPDSNKVNFDLFCESERAILRIQDFGIGVPPAERDRLFDSFHRCNNVGSIPGTGLGLPIVKRAIDLHGGQITIESEMGVGTVFTVTIPYLSVQ